MALRLKKRGEKALEKALNAKDDEDDADIVPSSRHKPAWLGRPDEETIAEGEEPPPTPMLGDVLRSHLHRREKAEVEVR
jgi:PH/SEC7 domain-containing protein